MEGITPEMVRFCAEHCRVCGGSGLITNGLEGKNHKFIRCPRCHGSGEK